MMDNPEKLAWLILFLPLLSAAIITVFTQNHKRLSGQISIGAVLISFLTTVILFWLLHASGQGTLPQVSTEWLRIADFKVDIGLKLDFLSLMMALIVTGVGSAIHIYSAGYMHDDRAYSRYFACLSLFTFSMLGIVLADNFLMMFIFWELVGVSSYLLIGFWYERATAADACKKAFLTNRIGDFGFLLGILMVWGVFSFHLNFDELKISVATHAQNLVWPATTAGLLIFCGAVGKSAQFPLHVWLPDAMEGPTPVSALIHAATMVTAGVYLIARTHPIFEQARTIELIAAGTGALTLVVAGLIALVQTDIKRVIAYSTMSQIGYMFLGAGVGAYANGMFHLMTHAFFKALLFMAAGIVIHALSGEQDIRKMRGIGALMPWTKWAFLAGGLALVGLPPFSGFFSKDSIIAAALHDHWYGVILAVAGLVGAFLTGVYTFRLYFIVFPGEPSPYVREHHHAHHGKEGPLTMLVPVGVLTVLAVIGGWIQFSPIWHPLTSWLEPAVRTLGVAEPTNTQEAVVSALAVLLGLAGVGVAWLLYGRGEVAVPRLPAVQRALEHKLYFDEAYDALFFKPAAALASWLRRDFEEPVVLATGPDLGELTLEAGSRTRRLQTGLVRTYVLFLGTGLAVVGVVFLIVK